MTDPNSGQAPIITGARCRVRVGEMLARATHITTNTTTVGQGCRFMGGSTVGRTLTTPNRHAPDTVDVAARSAPQTACQPAVQPARSAAMMGAYMTFLISPNVTESLPASACALAMA